MADKKKLADDETYLKRYENLSRGEKQELDLAKRQRLKEVQLEASQGDTFSQRAGDVMGRVLRTPAALAGNQRAAQEQAVANAMAAKREAERQRRLQEAKDSAEYKERDRAKYISDTPGKLEDNPLKFKKGGIVGSASKRADGIAQRGKTRGKMI